MAERSLYASLDKSRDEIRLVTILPGQNDNEPVSCQLETVRLTDDLEYAAMSYVWGDATVTKDILVNGVVFEATTNLEAGLWHFRKYGLVPYLPGRQSLRLWVDAICINQKDVAERGQQVALMGKIYSKADYVLTWLGLPGKYSIDNAVRLISSFSQALPDRLKHTIINVIEEGEGSDGSEKEQDDDGKNEEVEASFDVEAELIRQGLGWISDHQELHELEVLDHSNAAWSSFTALANLAYWERVWIQQERVLCRSFRANLVRCGEALTTFEDFILFFSFIHVLDRNSTTPPEINVFEWQSTLMTLKVPIVAPVISMRTSWKRGAISPDLIPRIAQRCVATDARDMIYGLEGLLNLGIDVSYEKTVREVYLDWHAKALEHSRGRGMLESCGIGQAGRGLYGDDNKHDLPSWLPDLARMHERRFVIHSDARSDAGNGKLGLEGARGQEYSEDGVLSVYGAVCGHVGKTSLLMEDPDEPGEALGKLAVDYAVYMKARDHPTGIRPLQALYYTIHQGTDPDTQQPFSDERRLDPKSISAQCFRVAALYEQSTTSTPGQEADWDPVDLEAAGGLDAYMESRFRDTADDPDENERWREALAQMSEDDYNTASQDFMSSFQVFLEGKAFFYTTDGYIGIAPKHARVGDKLCVINNCTLPVLIRADADGSGYYVLVGAAYVYGLSGDEPLGMLKPGGLKLEKFEIH